MAIAIVLKMQVEQIDISNKIRLQLEKILKSETFRDSKKLRNFLQFVIQQTIYESDFRNFKQIRLNFLALSMLTT